MITPGFVWKVITIPITALKTFLQYFTVGTVYQRTSHEFKSSLWKNIHLAIECHLAGNLHKVDVQTFVYRPVSEVFKQFENNPMVAGLNNFGKKLEERSYWIVQNEAEGPEKEDVIVYLHGGGYLLNIFESQFVTFIAFYYSLPEETRKKTSISVSYTHLDVYKRQV